MGKAEQEALRWLCVMGMPIHTEVDRWLRGYQSLCRLGLARCRFIGGKFCYQATDAGKAAFAAMSETK